MESTTNPLRIDVYADIACPWCYVGERRLTRALAQRSDLAVERRWRPFQLQRNIAPNGEPWRTFAEEKFGGWDRARSAFDFVRENADDVGIDFRFDCVATAPNTLDAHRLVLWARRYGEEWALVEPLFRAYFIEGHDLNDRDALADVAASAGLDGVQARAFLATSELRAEVTESQRNARQRGVQGVPFYVFDDTYTFSGAQTTELFLRACDAVVRERTSDEMPVR